MLKYNVNLSNIEEVKKRINVLQAIRVAYKDKIKYLSHQEKDYYYLLVKELYECLEFMKSMKGERENDL